MPVRANTDREADRFIDARSLTATNHKINHSRLHNLTTMIQRAGICDQLTAWRNTDTQQRHPGGRPTVVSDLGIITILVLLAVDGQPLHISSAADMIKHRLDATGRELLGIQQHLADGDDWYDRTWRALHRVLDVIDPYPAPRRVVTDQEFADILTNRTANNTARKIERLDWFANQLIDMTCHTLPRQVRRRWEGNICIDATPVAAFARPNTKRTGRTSEPDAAWYVRNGDHRDPGDSNGKTVTRSMFGYEAHIAVATPNSNQIDRPDFPLIATGMTFDKPGHNTATNALNILTSMHHRHFTPAVVVSDRAYWPGAKANKLQLPARALGWRNINDYRDDQLGVADGHAGGIQVEGAWYCPSMPQPLIDATIEHRQQVISDDEYDQRIQQRRRYLPKPKERPDADGHQPLRCPAIGKSATVACPLRNSPGTPVKIGATHIHTPPEHPDRICTQTSVSFPPTAGAKLRQDAHYGSPEWRQQYAVARNTIEGLNGYIKVGPEQLAAPQRRRIRGRTAQHISTALLVAAANLRKIRTWLTNAVHTDGEPHNPASVTRRAVSHKRRTSLRDHRPPDTPPDP